MNFHHQHVPSKFWKCTQNYISLYFLELLNNKLIEKIEILLENKYFIQHNKIVKLLRHLSSQQSAGSTTNVLPILKDVQ